MSTEEKNKDPETISENPVNVLFNTSSIAKKDVWEIDIVGILEMLLRILGKSGKKDLRVAGMAALSSSLIYRMKIISLLSEYKKFLNDLPVNELLAYIYSAYPNMTEESAKYAAIKQNMEKYIFSLIKKQKISSQRAAELLDKSQNYIIKKMNEKRNFMLE